MQFVYFSECLERMENSWISVIWKLRVETIRHDIKI